MSYGTTIPPGSKAIDLSSALRIGGRGGLDRLRRRYAETPPPDKFLEVEPLALTLSAAGTPVELTVRAQGVTWTAQPERDWVHLSTSTGDGNAVIAVSATPNSDQDERRTVLRFTADQVAPVEIAILQEATGPSPEPEPHAMTHTEGYWAGDYWETGGVLDDLFLVMTDRTIREGELQGEGYVLSLDLNIPAATFSTFEIAGNYTPSTALPPTVAHTFNADEVTYVLTFDALGNRTAQRYATGGSIEITGKRPAYRIDASLRLDDGTAFRATFDGTIPFFDNTPTVISTLTGDCHPELTAATGTFLIHTDQADSPVPLLLELTGTDGTASAHLQLLLNVTPQAQQQGNIAGTYRMVETPVPSDCPAGTAMPGTVTNNDDKIAFDGCWYLQYLAANASVPSGMAPLRGGQITVERSGEQFTVDYALTDDDVAQPHTVSGSYEGSIEFTNLSEPGPQPGDATAGGTLAPWKPGGRW